MAVFLNPDVVIGSLGLVPGMRVVDFSAGGGHAARAAARAVGGDGVVWVVGSHGELLAMVQNSARAEGLHNVEVMRGNIEAHGGSNLPPSDFDVALLINTLFTAGERVALAREMARVLKRGGHGLVVDWRDSYGGLGPHPEHVVTIGAARDVFEKADLAYVADVPTGDYHWGFLVRKM